MNNTNTREVQELLFVRQAMVQCVGCGYVCIWDDTQIIYTMRGMLCLDCYRNWMVEGLEAMYQAMEGESK